MVKRKISKYPSEDLTSLRNALGTESILAHCAGVNYQVYVTNSRLLIGKRFGLDENYVNVPTSNINTLELITKSLLPPMTFAILAAIGSLLVWWFPGQQRLALPSSPYDLVLVALLSLFLGALIAIWWRVGIAVLRIGIVGSSKPITVKLVSASEADRVFKALKG